MNIKDLQSASLNTQLIKLQNGLDISQYPAVKTQELINRLFEVMRGQIQLENERVNDQKNFEIFLSTVKYCPEWFYRNRSNLVNCQALYGEEFILWLHTDKAQILIKKMEDQTNVH